MVQDSFIFYRSFFKAITKMDDATLAESVKALCAYALDGEEIELEGVAGMFFDMAKPQIDANIKRREDGKKGAEYGKRGGRPRKKNPIGDIDKNPIGVLSETPNVNVNENVNVNANDNGNVNVNVNVNENVNEKKESGDKPHCSSKFTPPTIDEVKDYCWERNNGIDAQAFIDFYASKGWMIGKNKMKDWKAAVRTWEQRNRKEKPKGTVVNAADAFFTDIKGAMHGM